MIRSFQVLNHLKVIKFNVWEDTFEQSTKEVRELELRSLRQFLMLQALQSFLWNCAIFMVAFLSFSTYSILDTSNQRLTAQVSIRTPWLFRL